MIANKTYNNVINTLKNLGDSHEQIATVTTGDIFDINLEKMEKFALMHINPVNVTTGDFGLTYNFQIFICDLVSEKADWTAANIQSANNLSNEQEVLSETLQISVDIISMLRHATQQSEQEVDDINAPIYFAEGQQTLEPFTERFDNLLTGWVFSLSVLVANDFQSCTIPARNVGQGE
jgi:DNA-binding ferritin-like protein